jgi:glutamate carboxypeptidase
MRNSKWVGLGGLALLGMGAVCASGQASRSSATGEEAAMVAAVDREAPAGQELLRQLVEINSGTMNLAGVRAVGAVLEPKFAALGFRTRWVNMDEVHRAGHLIAEHPCPQAGQCGKRMLLIGHMDTVFERSSPFQHWSVNGATATGPGTNDMKGGLVVMLMALEAMQSAGVLQHTDITVVLSGDEEAHGDPVSVSRRDMVEAGKHADVALEFEGVPEIDGVYYGSISRRSSTTWHLKATGQTGHSSGIFSPAMGDGAIYELARILDEFRRQLPEQFLTYNVGLVAGGTRVESDAEKNSATAFGESNVVPPMAMAIGDLRTMSDEQTARAETKMKAIVAEHLPRTGAEINFSEGYPAMPPTEASRALLRTLNEVNKTLGVPEMPELDPMKRGAGLAGVGATGTGAHAPGETVHLPSQVLNAKRDALLMYRLSSEK